MSIKKIKPIAVIILDIPTHVVDEDAGLITIVRPQINPRLLSALKQVSIKDIMLLPLCPAIEQSPGRCPGVIMQDRLNTVRQELLNNQFTVWDDYSDHLYNKHGKLNDPNILLRVLAEKAVNSEEPNRFVIFKDNQYVADIKSKIDLSQPTLPKWTTEVEKTPLDFVIAAKALQLRVTCENYLNHLKLPKLAADINLTQEKQRIVNILLDLTLSPSPELLADFDQVLKDNRATLEARRDSATWIFLKVIFTILTLGIAAVCGLWTKEGKKVAADLDRTLSLASP